MVSQKVTIKNPTGLHLRPAGILCKEAMQFKSLITFTFRDNTANAKSVLSVLGACVKCGDEVEFCCEWLQMGLIRFIWVTTFAATSRQHGGSKKISKIFFHII